MKAELLQRKVGDAIRQNRAGLGLSQEAFADKVGMHRTYYSAIERGERNLTLQSLNRISEGLGVKLSDLFQRAGV